jgi:hypothetical protein
VSTASTIAGAFVAIACLLTSAMPMILVGILIGRANTRRPVPPPYPYPSQPRPWPTQPVPAITRRATPAPRSSQRNP